MTTRQRIDFNDARTRLRERQKAIDEPLAARDERQLMDVYQARARQLAKRSTTATTPQNTWPALIFTVGAERLCAPLAELAEILPYVRCAPLPGARAELAGLVNVRGRICSVLDVARLLELPASCDCTREYIVLVRHAGIEVGLRVDQVERIDEVTTAAANDLGSDLAASCRQYFQGWTTQRIAILNVQAVLSHPIFHSRDFHGEIRL